MCKVILVNSFILYIIDTDLRFTYLLGLRQIGFVKHLALLSNPTKVSLDTNGFS